METANFTFTHFETMQPELITSLLEMYLSSSRNHLANIKKYAAEDKRDDLKIKQAAFILKALSGNLGFTEIASLCQQLENTTILDQSDLCAFLSKFEVRLFFVQKNIEMILSAERALNHKRRMN